MSDRADNSNPEESDPIEPIRPVVEDTKPAAADREAAGQAVEEETLKKQLDAANTEIQKLKKSGGETSEELKSKKEEVEKLQTELENLRNSIAQGSDNQRAGQKFGEIASSEVSKNFLGATPTNQVALVEKLGKGADPKKPWYKDSTNILAVTQTLTGLALLVVLARGPAEPGPVIEKKIYTKNQMVEKLAETVKATKTALAPTIKKEVQNAYDLGVKDARAGKARFDGAQEVLFAKNNVTQIPLKLLFGKTEEEQKEYITEAIRPHIDTPERDKGLIMLPKDDDYSEKSNDDILVIENPSLVDADALDEFVEALQEAEKMEGLDEKIVTFYFNKARVASATPGGTEKHMLTVTPLDLGEKKKDAKVWKEFEIK